VGSLALVLVRTADEPIRAFDAVCPHRGAHLACGGRLAETAIVCPFHGHRIGLGAPSERGFAVKAYRTLTIGGMVFVLTSEAHEHGLTDRLAALDQSHFFVPGFAMPVAAAAELVIENGFDAAHFGAVHGVLNEPEFRVIADRHGALGVTGVFELPPSPWQRGGAGGAAVRVPYRGQAFSAGLFVSELGGDDPYCVVTAATPAPAGGCVIRLSVAVPAERDGRAPDAERCRYLLRQSRAGLEKDQVIWEHVVADAPHRLTPRDAPARAFQEFCRALDGPPA
jgi:phenylpropionate dioxygenase-like ring-hydroxylating dioxygenase large terminal subunit